MAIAALVLWMCTAAIGSYLLATSFRGADEDDESAAAQPASAQPASVSAAERVAAPAAPVAPVAPVAPAAPAKPVADRNRFDPPSLRENKSAPLPGLRALAEFTHPALAIIGLGLWLGYVLSRERVLLAIGLGVLIGAVCAGLSWFTVNTRDARRGAGGAGAGGAGGEPQSFSSRLIVMHAVGATLTLLFVALIAARV